MTWRTCPRCNNRYCPCIGLNNYLCPHCGHTWIYTIKPLDVQDIRRDFRRGIKEIMEAP